MKSSGMKFDGSNMAEAIEMVASRLLEGHENRGRIELLRFSGDADDIISDPNGRAVYLRCRTERHTDTEGNPYEFVVRLGAVGGFWHIPADACNIVALVPEQSGMVPGVAFGLFVHAEPRGKLTQDASFHELGDASLGTTGRAFAWKVNAGTQFGVDESGAFVISLPNGTHISLDPAGNTISLAVCDGATPNNVLAAIKLSEAGVQFVSQSTATGKKQIWSLDAASGDANMVGTGTWYSIYPRGSLGTVAPVLLNGIGYGVGAGSLQSATWFVSPT